MNRAKNILEKKGQSEICISHVLEFVFLMYWYLYEKPKTRKGRKKLSNIII